MQDGQATFQHKNHLFLIPGSRGQAAQHLAAAVSEYRAALRRPEALGGLADRSSVRYNFVCACVLAAGAAMGANATLVQARIHALAAVRTACFDLAETRLAVPGACRARCCGRSLP